MHYEISTNAGQLVTILTKILKFKNKNFEAHSFSLKTNFTYINFSFYLEIEKSLHHVITTEKDTS
jgi:hypothetical protein